MENFYTSYDKGLLIEIDTGVGATVFKAVIQASIVVLGEESDDFVCRLSSFPYESRLISDANKDIVMNNHTGAFSEGTAATRPLAITMDKKAVVNFMIVGWRSKAGELVYLERGTLVLCA